MKLPFNPQLTRILDSAQEGQPPSQEDCAFLLRFRETSFEAALIRAVADSLSRKRFNNDGIIMGQIGIEIAACPGKCKFCSFGEGHTLLNSGIMPDNDIFAAADEFTKTRDLHALFLMTMHNYDFLRLIRIVSRLRESIPKETHIVVNIGDFDRAQALDLKAAGVNGAYHICRLREGIDTAIDPVRRKATIRNIKDSGLDWYYCCEPIGPEHTPEEMAEQIFLGLEYGCFQHAAMRRIPVPSTPLAENGRITELRLAQVVAVVSLAVIGCPDTRSIAVHEPNLLGLTSGANTIYAEKGANPRDSKEDTTGHRGCDINDCKKMLCEAGFENCLVSDGKRLLLEESNAELF
jgi:biotin synthase